MKRSYRLAGKSFLEQNLVSFPISDAIPMFYFVRSEMEHYTMMQKMSRDIEEDEDWGPTIFDESKEEELIDDV